MRQGCSIGKQVWRFDLVLCILFGFYLFHSILLDYFLSSLLFCHHNSLFLSFIIFIIYHFHHSLFSSLFHVIIIHFTIIIIIILIFQTRRKVSEQKLICYPTSFRFYLFHSILLDYFLPSLLFCYHNSLFSSFIIFINISCYYHSCLLSLLSIWFSNSKEVK